MPGSLNQGHRTSYTHPYIGQPVEAELLEEHLTARELYLTKQMEKLYGELTEYRASLYQYRDKEQLYLTYIVGAEKIRNKWETVLSVLDMVLWQDDLDYVKIMIHELINTIEENGEY